MNLDIRWSICLYFLFALTFNAVLLFPLFLKDKKKWPALHTQQSQRAFTICVTSRRLGENPSGSRRQHCGHNAISFELGIFTCCPNFAFRPEGFHHTPPVIHRGRNDFPERRSVVTQKKKERSKLHKRCTAKLMCLLHF